MLLEHVTECHDGSREPLNHVLHCLALEVGDNKIQELEAEGAFLRATQKERYVVYVLRDLVKTYFITQIKCTGLSD